MQRRVRIRRLGLCSGTEREGDLGFGPGCESTLRRLEGKAEALWIGGRVRIDREHSPLQLLGGEGRLRVNPGRGAEHNAAGGGQEGAPAQGHGSHTPILPFGRR